MAEIGEDNQRIEILDWDNLRENLYKIEAKRNQIEQLKAYLGMGQVKTEIS